MCKALNATTSVMISFHFNLTLYVNCSLFVGIVSEVAMTSVPTMMLTPDMTSLQKEVILLADRYDSTVLGKWVRIAVIGRQTFCGLESTPSQDQLILQHNAG